MVVKAITYEDLNGNEIKEEFFFNLSKTELVKLQHSEEGGLEAILSKMIDTKDNKKIFEFFEHFVHLSYGVPSADGKHFRKSKEILDDFISSPAYDIFFMEIITDEKKMADFINEVIPKKLAEEVSEMLKKQQEETTQA